MRPDDEAPARQQHRPYRWLPLLIAAITVITLGAGGLALHRIETRLVATMGESLALLAADIADKLDLVLFERYGDVQIMADTLSTKMHDAAVMTQYLDRMKERYLLYRWLGVTDAQGRMIASTDPASVGQDQHEAVWFQAVRDGKGIHLLDVSDSSESGGSPAIGFSAPITSPDGTVLGVVTTRVGLRELEDIFGRTISAYQQQRHAAGRIEWQFLMRDGTLATDSLLREEGKTNLKQQGLPSALLSGATEPGYVEELHIRQQVPVITGYARTEGYGEFPGFRWGILVRADRSDILAPIRSMVWQVGLAGSVVLGPLIGLLLWTTRRVQQEWANSADQLSRLKGLHTVSQTLQQETSSLNADFALTQFLQLLVDTATQVTGARYGAFGLFDETGKHLLRFMTTGMDQATQQTIGTTPTGRGLLGFLAQEADVLRLKDLTRHPTFTGFPPNHPPMRSFLGASVRAHGRVFGRLYLTEKCGAGEFTEIDEEVIASLAAQAGIAIENGYFLNQIRAAEIQYRTTMAALPVAVVRLDQHNIVRFANRLFYEFIQRNETDTIGQPIGTLLPFEELTTLLRAVRTQRTPASQEQECLSPLPGITHCRLIATTVRETDEVILVIKDISAQKQAEQERTKLLQDRLLLLDSTGEGIFGIDAEARCTFINKAGAAILGYRPEDMLGRNIHELIHHTRKDGSPYPLSDCPIVHACRSGLGHHLDDEVLWRQDGTSFPAEYSAHPIVEDGRILGAVVTFTDITERKRTETAFLSLVKGTAGSVGEEFFRSLVRQLAVALNVRYALVAEYTNEARDRARTIAIWGGTDFPDNVEYPLAGTPCEGLLGRTDLFYPRGLRQQFPSIELLATLGAESYLGISLRDTAGRALGLLVVMDTDPMHEDEFSKSLLTIFGARAAAELERKKVEDALRANEEQLRQAQKMEAVGRLAGGIAHDFNNLLMVMLGYSDTLLHRIEDDSPLRRYPLEIKKASDQAASLTQQLLAFSRQQALEPKVLDLNDSVASMSGMLQRLIGEHIELVTRLNAGIGRVKADPGQIEQVIMNLVINARDAMPEGGTLTVTTDTVDIDRPLAEAIEGIPPGSYVALSVSDTGHGMEPATLAHIFEPFFTTKEKGKGTGLGLASVYGIVKQSGGGIGVASAPAQGTTFTVYLPQVSDPAVAVTEAEPIGTPAGGSETVLLAEDEEMVRILVREVLQEAGYRVLEARGGAEALALSARHAKPIHLLLTDVVMPHIKGRELADQLIATRPDMKILYLTGYTDDIVLQQGHLQENASVLHKPFLPETLLRKVRDVLDAQQPE